MVGKEGGLWQPHDVANQHLFNRFAVKPVDTLPSPSADSQHPGLVGGEVAPIVEKPEHCTIFNLGGNLSSDRA